MLEGGGDDDSTPVKRNVYPDVRVVPGSGGEVGDGEDSAGGTATIAKPKSKTRPFKVSLLNGPVRQRFVQVRDHDGDKVLTVIEFVSPANKRAGDGRNKYQQKQQECRENGINLVEIDLTRAGRRRLLAPPVNLPRAATDATYLASVYRSWEKGYSAVYAMPLRSPLAELPVPIRKGEAEPTLVLRPLLDQVYDNANYRYFLAYKEPADPPLRGSEAKWADALLREAGLRGEPPESIAAG